MADIPLPQFYPDTLFIDSYLSNPVEADLARAVYVTDFLADGSPMLQRAFSTVASHELVSTNDDHQERLNRAADRLSDLMETSFVALLAKGDQDLDSPAFDIGVIEAKGERLTRTWNMMQANPFMQAIGEARGNGERFIEEELKIKWGKPRHVDHALLYYDYVRLDPESDSRQRGGPVRESMVREAIIENDRRTGVTGIDEYFEYVRKVAQLDTYRTPLAAIRKRWEYWHPNEEFFPADYLAGQQDLRSNTPVLLRGIASVLGAVSSFRLWQGIEKDVAKWEAAERA